MPAARLPENEKERLAALSSYHILDTLAEQGCDDIVRMAAMWFDVPTCLISLVETNRQWFKAKVGLNVCETGRDESFCSHAILDEETLVIPDAREDPRFADNSLVTQAPHIRFYAGAPLIDPDGYALGTLCLIDYQPRKFTSQEVQILESMARQVVDQFRLRKTTAKARENYDQLQACRDGLEDEVARRTRQVVETREEVVHCLARAAEFRDDDTGHHVRRVSRYVGVIARQMGLDQETADRFELAATLHDIGKIGVPDAILLKPGKLTEQEFAVMQGHTQWGAEVLERMENRAAADSAEHCELGARIIGEPQYDLLQTARRIAETHHEKFDGSGYPRGLAGDDIPLEGRITAVADVFDALSSQRPYKPAFPLPRCYDILDAGRGAHFDPAVVEAFTACRTMIESIRERWSEPDACEAEHAA
jgi:response regulator RpfG family c-di-GMP phosphodiesterase